MSEYLSAGRNEEKMQTPHRKTLGWELNPRPSCKKNVKQKLHFKWYIILQLFYK